ncbi:MAG TPA: ATP-binding protein [Stellaceae bacterium]|nr:ATP-binding protein [Stellaceae bacterium]
MPEARLSVRADAEAPRALGRFLEAFARAHGVEGDDIARFLVALEELVSNLVKYGYDDPGPRGTVAVTLRLADRRLKLEIVDDGRPFDPFAQAPPDLDAPLEERPVGGLGLHLVRRLMDEARYRREGHCNVTEIGRPIRLA